MKPVCIKTFAFDGHVYRLMYDKYKEGLEQYWIETPENCFGYADFLYLRQTEGHGYFFVQPLYRKYNGGFLDLCFMMLMGAYELA